MKTTSDNMIASAAAYKKFKAIGMYDVIKLDGGGSFHFNANGKVVASTSEDRLINTIIRFGGVSSIKPDVPTSVNKFPVPTRTLKQGSTGDDVKWLQAQLNTHGVSCSVDGAFGPKTVAAVKVFQSNRKLAVDGIVGPATRAALM